MKKVQYIYTMEYYSDTLKKWNNAICNNMDGLGDSNTKWNVRHRKINIIWYNLYVESKKWYKLTYLKTEINSQTWKANLRLPKEMWEG